MQCTSPVVGYRAPSGVVFSDTKVAGDQVLLPCGRCIGCRLDRSRDWALRCVHESKLYDQNSFITLTYDDNQLPPGCSLVPEHLQLFWKRLRRAIEPVRIRYFACGEYGDDEDLAHRSKFGGNVGRPHYHALIFNYDFPDKVFFKKRPFGDIFTSKILAKAWPFGHSSIGALSFRSAGYVARYSLPRVNGEGAATRYFSPVPVVNPVTGEVLPHKVPEFGRMSNREGIGANFFRLFWQDFADGFAVVDGQRLPLPRFYKKRLKLLGRFDDAMADAAVVGYARRSDNTPERLEVKAAILQARSKSLKRE